MKKLFIVSVILLFALTGFACSSSGTTGGNLNSNNAVANTPGFNRPLNAEELKIKEEGDRLKKELDEMQKRIDAEKPVMENMNKKLDKLDKDIKETERKIKKVQ